MGPVDMPLSSSESLIAYPIYTSRKENTVLTTADVNEIIRYI